MTTPLASILLNLASIACAAIILARAESATAKMGSGTKTLIRYAMLLLAGGAITIILTILSGNSVDFSTLLLLAGIALLLICERRLRYLITRPGDRHA
ncbi:MAG: hypothetical protein WA049_06725 [Ferribacterium limneticum]